MPGRVLLVEAVVQVIAAAQSAAAAAVAASVGLPGGSRRPGEPQPVQVDQRVSAEVLFEPSFSTLQKNKSTNVNDRDRKSLTPHPHYHQGPFGKSGYACE